MRLYDSLKKEVLPFEPADGKTFRIYACGPTVYKDLTIGNWRTFLTTDLLRRYLEYRGHGVKLVMNLTDVGHMLNDADTGTDKLEAAAKEEGKTPAEIADTYAQAFFRDGERLGFKPAWKHPRATEHIKEMVKMIETLIEKDHAYVTAKNDIYYDVASFKDYGKLSGNTVDALKAGARASVKDDKRNPADFALWISNPNHVMQWTGPQGIKGYPGWHIECSAMAMKYLGETLDLHVGGEDLKFPHHECEIAQSEGATGKEFSRRWLHVKYLMVDGEKMSKSKNNFYTLDDIVDKGYEPETLRYLLLSAHYRTPLNFTFEGLDAARKTLASLREVAVHLQPPAEKTDGISTYEQRFQEAMDEDMNVSEALAVILECAKDVRKGSVSSDDAAKFFHAIDDVFGLNLFKHQSLEIPVDVQALVEERSQARADKRWGDADRLRGAIAARGFAVEDGPEGQKLKKT